MDRATHELAYGIGGRIDRAIMETPVPHNGTWEDWRRENWSTFKALLEELATYFAENGRDDLEFGCQEMALTGLFPVVYNDGTVLVVGQDSTYHNGQSIYLRSDLYNRLTAGREYDKKNVMRHYPTPVAAIVDIAKALAEREADTTEVLRGSVARTNS